MRVMSNTQGDFFYREPVNILVNIKNFKIIFFINFLGFTILHCLCYDFVNFICLCYFIQHYQLSIFKWKYLFS